MTVIREVVVVVLWLGVKGKSGVLDGRK